MLTEKNRDIARRFHACDPGDYAGLLAEGFVGHNVLGHTWDRAFQIKGLADDLASFRGLHDTIHDIVAEADKVVVRFTRSGFFHAKFEDFPPTNTEVHFPVMELMRIENGKIVELWAYNDDGHVRATLEGHRDR